MRRILVARRARLGDLVVFLPTLAALRRRYPTARIVLGVHPRTPATAVLSLAEPGLVDEILMLDQLDAPSLRLRVVGMARLAARGFDLVISGARHFIMREALLCGAPYRAGLDDGDPAQRLNTVRVSLDPSRHEAENNLAVVERIGCRAAGEQRIPRFAPPPGEDRTGALLRDVGVPPGAPFAVLHPGAQKPSRQWPAERFAELAEALVRERGLHVVLSGGDGERTLAESVIAGVPADVRDRVHSAAGRTGIVELVALLRGAGVVVSNDTGVMHLARAAGARLVALLGPENPARWGPHPDGAGQAIALRHEVPCAPCQRWSCGPHYCLRSIAVGDVLDAALDLLDHRDGERPPLEWRGSPRSWIDLDREGHVVPRLLLRINGGRAGGGRQAEAEMLARQEYPGRRVVQSADDATPRIVEVLLPSDALPANGSIAATVADRMRSEEGKWPLGEADVQQSREAGSRTALA